jgi:hypothetical protein
MAENGGKPTGLFWSVVGGLSGGAMGFIVANFPGMVAGAVAGNRLGAVRDAKGKSVYQVFQDLPQGTCLISLQSYCFHLRELFQGPVMYSKTAPKLWSPLQTIWLFTMLIH